jgi:alkane 1-monooxygenase
MPAADASADSAPSPPRALRVWALHLISTGIPLYVLGYLLTGPHVWYVALPSLAIIPALMWVDRQGGKSRHEPVDDLPSWPFDLLLLVLTALQLANIVLAARMMRGTPLISMETFVTAVLVGANTGYSAIVVAHELIHRRSRFLHSLGRLLMATALYEHFSTEHVRGHHVRVGTEEDPATARYGESFAHFWRRTIPAQFRSAWRIEARRLGEPGMTRSDPRLLRSAVLHGVVFEVLLALLILVTCGLAAFVMFLGQAFVAVGLLEAVNYFEHYGLRRTGRKVRPVDSWDSDSAFTLFGLVGLSRHSDHHAHAARPFQTLRLHEESPKLPDGYIVTALMVIFANARVRERLGAELERRGLGPFASSQALG